MVLFETFADQVRSQMLWVFNELIISGPQQHAAAQSAITGVLRFISSEPTATSACAPGPLPSSALGACHPLPLLAQRLPRRSPSACRVARPAPSTSPCPLAPLPPPHRSR